jgi:hypothetical protein
MNINKKIYTLFYLSFLILLITENRFGGRGRRNNGSSSRLSRGSGSGGGRKNNSKNNNGNRNGSGYHHGDNNRFNRNNFGGNYVTSGIGWGLVGGMGIGLMLGSGINSSSNVTVINKYDESNKSKLEENNDYSSIYKKLLLNIDELKNLSEEIESETNKLKKNNNSTFIKIHFSPYNKIDILTTRSNEVYGDNKKERIEIAIFRGDQVINQRIISIRDKTKNLLGALSMAKDEEYKQKYNEIKNKLIIILKILNENLVSTTKILQKE